MQAATVVWLKRDLRLHDHRPLFQAAQEGPVHLLYVFEPSLWSTEEYAWRQLAFVHASLEALQNELYLLLGDTAMQIRPRRSDVATRCRWK